MLFRLAPDEFSRQVETSRRNPPLKGLSLFLRENY